MKLFTLPFGFGKRLRGASFLCLLVVSESAYAQSFSYTISGTANDWTLDFTVTDPLAGGKNISQFTLYDLAIVSGYSATGSPAGFTASTTGDVAWTGGLITPGNTVSGFDVLDTADAVAPTTEPVRFDGTGYDPLYVTANGAPASAPDSGSTFLLLGMGVAALGVTLRHRSFCS
jgi:hypothetical protein